jgi:hypothetical protein
MIVHRTVAVAIACCGLLSAAAFGKDAAIAREAVALPVTNTAPAVTESIGVAVYQGREPIWTGSLRLGGPYGSASFSQSRNEYGEICPAEPGAPGRQVNSSESLNFSISRYNSQQELDRFNITLNWSRPVPRCQGEGNDTYGFNRVVNLPRGESVTIEGNGGVSVRLTRAG